VELERTVGYRIVHVGLDGVGRHHVINFIVRHGARAQVIEAGENYRANQQDYQQFFDGQGWPPGYNGFVQPAVGRFGRGRGIRLSSHTRFSVLRNNSP